MNKSIALIPIFACNDDMQANDDDHQRLVDPHVSKVWKTTEDGPHQDDWPPGNPPDYWEKSLEEEHL